MMLVEGIATVDDVDAFITNLRAVGEEHDCAVTAVDARYVAGRPHLQAAVDRANRAFERDDTIADDRSIEILLYAAGRRQIERALEMGVGEGRTAAVIVIDGEDESGAASAVAELFEEEPVLDAARDDQLIRAFFDISDLELAATDAPLVDLVVERVSLLAVEK